MHQGAAPLPNFVAHLVGVAEALPQCVRSQIQAIRQLTEFHGHSAGDRGEVGQHLVCDPRDQVGVEIVFGKQYSGVAADSAQSHRSLACGPRRFGIGDVAQFGQCGAEQSGRVAGVGPVQAGEFDQCGGIEPAGESFCGYQRQIRIRYFADGEAVGRLVEFLHRVSVRSYGWTGQRNFGGHVSRSTDRSTLGAGWTPVPSARWARFEAEIPAGCQDRLTWGDLAGFGLSVESRGPHRLLS